MGTLKPLSFQRFAIWTALITLFYMLYGVHRTYQAEEMGTRGDCDVDNQAIMINSSAQQTKLDNIQLVVPVITQVWGFAPKFKKKNYSSLTLNFEIP